MGLNRFYTYNGKPIRTANGNPIGYKFIEELNVDTNSLSFKDNEGNGETKYFNITSNTDWVITKGTDTYNQISISPINGNGNATISVIGYSNEIAWLYSIITINTEELNEVINIDIQKDLGNPPPGG
jgi:hypothetical protein